MSDLTISIVNWNTRDILLGCLESLARHPSSRSADVWVVDNASADGSAEAVRTHYPQVHLIANAENVGFAAANNQAIAASSGRYVLLLNSDTEVLPGTLDRLCEYLDAHQEVGAVGCRLLNADGSTQRSAWRGYPGLRSAVIEGFYLWRLLPFLVRSTEVSLADNGGPQRVDHLLGACILVRRAVIDQIGGLDDGYYLFFEETDWCRRMQNAGWQIVYLPDPRIIHFGQKSMGQVPSTTLPIFYASLCRFVRRGGGPLLGLRLLLLKMVLGLSVVLRLGLWSRRLVGGRAASLQMLGGYVQVLRQLPSL